VWTVGTARETARPMAAWLARPCPPYAPGRWGWDRLLFGQPVVVIVARMSAPISAVCRSAG